MQITNGFTHKKLEPKGTLPQTTSTLEWYTPQWIFEKLNIKFDHDIAFPDNGIRHNWAANFVTPVDALYGPEWTGRVWLNPPYDKSIDHYVNKFLRNKNGILLTYSRMDTKWAQNILKAVRATNKYSQQAVVCFIEGRVKFVDRNGNERGTPGTGSMLVGFGPESIEAIVKANLGGLVW